MATGSDLSEKKLDQLEPTFMYTQILKKILLEIKFEPKHFMEVIFYCRERFNDNEGELQNVDKLNRKYQTKTTIWWYTYECFLYPILNRALRLVDVDIIIRMGFFIHDLHRQIEELHKEQFSSKHFNNIFTVYRGQGMTKTEFEKLIKTKGGLLSFNSFLSTSKDRDVSLDFSNRAISNSDMVGILLVMMIDPSQSTTSFGSIVDVSYFEDEEDEVLFSMHTVFRIQDIQPMVDGHRLFRIELTLTSDNDKDLRTLTDRIKEETFSEAEQWYRLALVLLKMGQFEKCEHVYEILLEDATDEREKAPVYHQLATVKYHQGKYEEAIIFYEKSIEIKQKTIPIDQSSLVSSISNVANLYVCTKQHQKTLSYFAKAVEIQKRILSPDDPDLAGSYSNIGEMCHYMGNYSKALPFFEKAFQIRLRILPANHPDLFYRVLEKQFLTEKAQSMSNAFYCLV